MLPNRGVASSSSSSSSSSDVAAAADAVLDAWSLVPIRNARIARETEELSGADRAATALSSFGDFPNLKVLWLQGNRVGRLTDSDCVIACDCA
jgi:hypothetical protein